VNLMKVIVRLITVATLMAIGVCVLAAPHKKAAPVPVMRLVHEFKEPPSKGESGWPHAVFTPDGKRLICAFANRLAVWDARTFGLLKTLRPKAITTGLAVSRDGRYLAATEVVETNPEHEFTRLTIWDMRTYAVVKRVTSNEDLGEMCFSPRSNILAVAMPRKTKENSQYDIILLRAPRWQRVQRLHSEEEMSPVSLAWSRDGTLIAGCNYYSDAGVGTVSVWRVRDSKRLYYYDSDASYLEGHFVGLPDSPLFFVGKTHQLACGVDIVNLDSRRRPITHIVGHSDGIRRQNLGLFGRSASLVLLDQYKDGGNFSDPFTVYDPLRRRLEARFRSPRGHEHIIAVSPDARLLVASGGDEWPGVPRDGVRIYAAPAGIETER
jgi:WD40 repeat protein